MIQVPSSVRRMALGMAVGTAVIGSATLAVAQPYPYGPAYGPPGVVYAPGYHGGAHPYWNDMDAVPYEGRSSSSDYALQREYNRSGTIGRLGLGADPRHPEGPGNQSLGGFR